MKTHAFVLVFVSLVVVASTGIISATPEDLVPSPGIITITISRESMPTRTVSIRNSTTETITGFNAYMYDTQPYGPSGLDWIIVGFEAPSRIEHGSTVSVTLSMFPEEVPSGTYERKLIVEAWNEVNRKVTTEVELNITVYGPTEPPLNVLLDFTPDEVCEGDEVSLLITSEGMPIVTDVWLGSTKLGTADINGRLNFNAPLIKGIYIVSVKIDEQVIATSNLFVYKKVIPVILIPENSVQGEPIKGLVIDEDGNPVSRITVACGGQGDLTDEGGSFSIPTGDLGGGVYSVRTLQRIDENTMLMYPQSSALVGVIGKSFVESIMPYVFALVIVIIIAIVILLVARWSRSLPAPS